VLMAVVSLVFVIPMTIVFSFFPGRQGQADFPPVYMLLMFPVMYLVMGYVMTVIGCALYNAAFRFIGGIEYESTQEDA